MKWLLLSCAFSSALLCGCAMEPDDARPGINHREMHALVEYYYGDPNKPAPTYSARQLDDLLSWDNPHGSAEKGEQHAAAVASALASAGDDRFAAALSRQSNEIKAQIKYVLLPLWTRCHLHYPKTKAVLSRVRLMY